MAKNYVFIDNQSGERVVYSRQHGEYREVSDNLWRNGSRLYPCLKITNLNMLIEQMRLLDYSLEKIQ